MLIIVRPELPPITLNTDECSELWAYLSYGHWPVPRCPDKGRLSVYTQVKYIEVHKTKYI